MIVDASAVLAVLMHEDDAATYAQAIADAPERAMSAVNWLETAMAVDRRGDAAARNAFSDFFDRGDFKIIPVTPEIAALARHAFAEWGKARHRARLNMGDCIAYATARSTGRPLLFKGNDFIHTDIEPAPKD
jgi:ribonuclease VapC